MARRPIEGTTVDVVVVGAGIAGLVTAWEAARRGASVALLEASAAAGGKIGAVDIAGRVIETGPDAFLARVPWAVDLCRDLGIETDLVAPGTGHAWLWTRGRLRPLPPGLVLGVPSRLVPLARSGVLSPRGVVRAALDEVRPRTLPPGDLCVSHAIGAHLGREVVDRLVDPLLGGIFAGNCDRMSMMASAPQLLAPARQPRMMRALRAQAAVAAQVGPAQPVVGASNTAVSTHEKGQPVFLTPRGGIPALVDALVRQLPPGALQLGCSVQSVRRAGGRWHIGGLAGRHLVLTTPAFTAAELIEPHNPTAAADLAAIEYSSVALALLVYRSADVTLPPGSGMLVPRIDGHLMTASSWWDQKWPHRASADTVVIRASAGRVGDQRVLSLSDDDLAARLHAELAEAIGTVPGCAMRAAPIAVHIARWPLAFPQYDADHLDRVARIEEALRRDSPSLHVTGAAFRGVGLPACIREARAVGAAVAEPVERIG